MYETDRRLLTHMLEQPRTPYQMDLAGATNLRYRLRRQGYCEFTFHSQWCGFMWQITDKGRAALLEDAAQEDRTMLTLSIRQPWAELILSGRKTIEVRSWTTCFRRPFLIHASQRIDLAACERNDIDHKTLITGAIVGQATLAAIGEFDACYWEMTRQLHLCDGEYPGHLYAWFLEHPKRIDTPIPARGKLGLWTFDLAEHNINGLTT